MSTQALGSSSGVPAGELQISQRVRELQEMIQQARQAASSTPITDIASAAAGNPTDFAAALRAATTDNSAPLAYPQIDPTTTPYSTQPLTGAAIGAPTGSETGASVYDGLIDQSAERYGVDPAILHGLIQQESGFDPNAQSSAGASGLTQLMPGTASSLGVANPLDPAESIEGGARYLSQLMTQFAGNTTDALAAYNAGPGAVQQYGGVPPYAETQSYVSKVLGYAEAYRQGQSVTEPTGMAA